MKAILLAMAVFCAPTVALGASATDVDASARAIFGEFMSPYCPGLLLADCSSGAAIALRAEIRADLEAGRSAAEVRAALEATYGDRVLAAPRTRGFGLWAWVTPAVFVALGALVVFFWARRSRQLAVAPPAPGFVIANDPALQARLDRELRTFDSN